MLIILDSQAAVTFLNDMLASEQDPEEVEEACDGEFSKCEDLSNLEKSTVSVVVI